MSSGIPPRTVRMRDPKPSYGALLLPDLKQMLEQDDQKELAEFCSVLHPVVAAEVLEELEPSDVWRAIRHSGIDRLVELFTYLPLHVQEELVDLIERPRLAELIQHMAPDDRIAILSRMDKEHVDAVMPLIAQAERNDIRKQLEYPEGSAGALMTTEYASLPEDLTVRDALERLRQLAPDSETIYYIYIVDENRRLDGLLSLRELILARPTARLSDLMQRDVVSVRVDEDREFAAQEIARYDFIALPVVDDQNRLVGIITHDDVIDVLQEEATEDAYRQAAVQPIEDSYLETPMTTLWWKRSVWLGCLFVAEVFTFSAMATYEHALEQIKILAMFVPLCISTGGNSGSQAGTLIIRAMALGDVKPGDWFKVLRHELVMGVALGVTLATVGFLRVAMTPGKLLGDVNRWVFAGVIFQAVACICLWGTVVGAMLPLIFRRLGFDPGYASSPFVATFVDCTGIMIYLSIAEVWLL